METLETNPFWSELRSFGEGGSITSFQSPPPTKPDQGRKESFTEQAWRC